MTNLKRKNKEVMRNFFTVVIYYPLLGGSTPRDAAPFTATAVRYDCARIFYYLLDRQQHCKI
jgi:hypothetical protein